MDDSRQLENLFVKCGFAELLDEVRFEGLSFETPYLAFQQLVFAEFDPILVRNEKLAGPEGRKYMISTSPGPASEGKQPKV